MNSQNCLYCKYIKHKKTKESKTNYGKCSKTELLLVAVKDKCKYFKRMDG